MELKPNCSFRIFSNIKICTISVRKCSLSYYFLEKLFANRVIIRCISLFILRPIHPQNQIDHFDLQILELSATPKPIPNHRHGRKNGVLRTQSGDHGSPRPP